MKIVFMGTPDFAVASLDAICASGHKVVGVVTVPDRPTGRGLKVTASPVKQYALQHNLPLLQPERLRDPDFQSALQAWGADIFVVVAFRMLPQSVWAMPPMGTFNLHASLLPQFRGAAPINWAIINGEKETGVTTFLLNERIDEGSILMQQSTPIAPAVLLTAWKIGCQSSFVRFSMGLLQLFCDNFRHIPDRQPPVAVPSDQSSFFADLIS